MCKIHLQAGGVQFHQYLLQQEGTWRVQKGATVPLCKVGQWLAQLQPRPARDPKAGSNDASNFLA